MFSEQVASALVPEVCVTDAVVIQMSASVIHCRHRSTAGTASTMSSSVASTSVRRRDSTGGDAVVASARRFALKSFRLEGERRRPLFVQRKVLGFVVRGVGVRTGATAARAGASVVVVD